MEDRYVQTVQGMPVTFELRAQDEDIDPLDPDAHPLRFQLLAGPEHGVLLGDLSAIRFAGPHDAVVELTYVPSTGFVGTDVVELTVLDPFDAAGTGTVTLQVVVMERRMEGLLSGSWSMNATFLPQSGAFTAFRSQVTEVYRIGGLTVKGIAQWLFASVGGADKVVFDALRLVGDVERGPLDMDSTWAFQPDAATVAEMFDYWRTTTQFAVAGVSFRHTFYLGRSQGSSYQELYARGSLGELSFTNTLRMGMGDGCWIEFTRNHTSMAWTWCDLPMSATLKMKCTGFDEATFGVKQLPLSWLLPGMSLNATVAFTEADKSVAASLVWRPASLGCFRLYGQLALGDADELVVDGLSIYGVKFETSLGGVRVVSASSFDASKNASVTGQTDYWEVLRLSGTTMGCCGAPGIWGLATYFHDRSGQLFDWGMTTAHLELGLSDTVSGSFETVVRSGELGDPKLELSFGLVVRW